MTTSWQPPSSGPIDDVTWPDKLSGAVVEAFGSDDRVHGYSVLGDLARHYAHSDHLFLAVTGDLPSDRASRLFRLGLIAWSPVSIAEAPTHVAVLSRICGGTFSAAMGAGLATLAERARSIVESHEPLLAWLAHPDPTLPAVATAPDGAAVEWIDTLRALAEDLQLLDARMTRTAASLTLLFEAGVRDSERMQAAIVLAGSASVLAEALAASPKDLPAYPITLPPFHYVESP